MRHSTLRSLLFSSIIIAISSNALASLCTGTSSEIIACLNNKLQYVSVTTDAGGKPLVVVQGANVLIRKNTDGDKTGNLIIGNNGHTWTDATEGFVLGAENTISGPGVAIIGGKQNIADGDYSAVVGGRYNETTGFCSSITGGNSNEATYNYSSVSGGQLNVSSGRSSAISGGYDNAVTGDFSSISGGRENEVDGQYSTIAGGWLNATWVTSDYASVLGGWSCVIG